MNGVFISYVRENIEAVDRFYQELTSHGIRVWRDRNDIDPGARWKQAIRKAIRQGAFFIACFSREYNNLGQTYMNEELTLAIEELRQRPTDRIWFIPVKLNSCDIPDRNIGGGETLQDLQYVNLYEDWDGSIQRIFEVIRQTARDEFSRGVKCMINERSLRGPALSPEEIQRNFEQAINHYSRALVKTDDAEVYLNRGIAYFGVNRIDDAIKDFTKAIQLDSELGPAYHNRGLAYCKKLFPDQAIKDFTKAIQLDKRLVNAYNSRGIVWLFLRNWDNARADLNAAGNMGVDIIANFCSSYGSVAGFEQMTGIQLPGDIAAMLTPQQ